MSRKAERVAESIADATTRRGFLGRLARVAGGAAAGMAAILATGSALGAPKEKKGCVYTCPPYGYNIVKWVPAHKPCPKKWKGCSLW
jgi:hypothetical protein